MTDNEILAERLDTGFKDKDGNIIFIGSVLSDPSYERCCDVFPGVVKINHDGRLIIFSKSTKGNGIGIRYLTKSSAADCHVLEAHHD